MACAVGPLFMVGPGLRCLPSDIDRSPHIMASVALFAWLLTLVDVEHAGRAYAAYGGVYIVSSVLWLWIVGGARPDRWDLIGAAVCLGGAAIILFGPRNVVGL